MAVTMKNAIFWDITPCDYCKDRRLGELGTALGITSNFRFLQKRHGITFQKTAFFSLVPPEVRRALRGILVPHGGERIWIVRGCELIEKLRSHSWNASTHSTTLRSVSNNHRHLS
jgi:hypothetical protein